MHGLRFAYSHFQTRNEMRNEISTQLFRLNFARFVLSKHLLCGKSYTSPVSSSWSEINRFKGTYSE